LYIFLLVKILYNISIDTVDWCVLLSLDDFLKAPTTDVCLFVN